VLNSFHSVSFEPLIVVQLVRIFCYETRNSWLS